jgi:hypothetical protein
MSEKPECFGCFPSIPPLAETCYRTCKHSIILCKKATYEKEHENESPLVRFLNSKFDELQSKPLTSWKKSIREYVIDWVNEFQTNKSKLTEGT